MMPKTGLGAAIAAMAVSLIAAEAQARPIPRDRPAAAIPVERPHRGVQAGSTQAPLPHHRPPAAAPAAMTGSLPAAEPAPSHEQQATCLAQAIYFEARSEPLEGQFAVARVVLNRTASRRYPDTICGVVFQNDDRKNECQFSFACDGLADEPEDATAWALARGMAEALIRVEQPLLSRRVLKATHYHADYVTPWWAAKLRTAGRVGRHIFYVRGDRGETKHASAADRAAR